MVLGLDELWQRRILREQGVEGYDFSHGKLREVAYAQLSCARRRLLHRRVAEAIEAVHTDTLEAVRGQLAMHYEQAGLSEQAVVSYQQAAEAARHVYAHTEALTWLQHALSLLETSSFATSRHWCSVHALLLERMGDILLLTVQYDIARSCYQRALTLFPCQEPISLARLHQKIAKTWEGERKYEDALRAYREAESRLGQRPAEAAQAWWQEWIAIQDGRMEVHYWLAQVEEMASLIEETWLVVEQYGTSALCASFFLSLAKINLRRDKHRVSAETLSYAQLALDAYQESGDLVKISWARYYLGWYHLWHSDLGEAEAQGQHALTMTEKTGDLALQSQCHTFLSVAKRKQRQIEEARQACAQATRLLVTTQRSEDRGVINANMAWIAWHEGNLASVEAYSLAALTDWQQTSLVYPFHWMALWPLIAVTLAQGRILESIGHAYALLVPDQQSLPDALMDAVNQAIQAREDDQLEHAYKHLQHALAVAQEMGYL
jgi:eukaryotic-like serine/threonine-protein kinase